MHTGTKMIYIEKAQNAIKRKNDCATWKTAIPRLSGPVEPKSNGSFKLSKDSKIYTIGSCFARNIEEHLSILGCTIPTLGFSVPRSEWKGLRTNGILNKYTPAAILQDVQWAEKIFSRDNVFYNEDSDIFKYELNNGLIIDLQLGGFVPVTEQRFYKRRKEIYQLTRQIFSADCITITLGMIEAWCLNGTYVQQPPTNRHLLKNADNFEFHILDYLTCLEFIQTTINLIVKHNPNVKFLITTSPVPMERTFSGEDCIIANSASKSTLRTVAAEVSKNNRNVDYFPSYEAVTLSDRTLAYEDDFIHIRDSIVGHVVSRLISTYIEGLENAKLLFQQCAVALDNSGQTDEMHKLIALKPDINTLNEIQLITFLRICWRTKNREKAQIIGKELLRRPTRSHACLRGIAHIFPKIGMNNECTKYANDILAIDPENTLAQKCLNA